MGLVAGLVTSGPCEPWISGKIESCSFPGRQLRSDCVQFGLGLTSPDTSHSQGLIMIVRVSEKTKFNRIQWNLGSTLQHAVVSITAHHYVRFYTAQTTVSKRAFPVFGANLSNELPSNITSTPSLSVFRQRLKTAISRPTYLTLY